MFEQLKRLALVAAVLLAGCGGGSDDPAPPPPAPPATVGPPVVDSARASSASIGPEGGTLRTTAADGVEYTLTVPAGALTETVTIRMTPIVDINNPVLANGLTGAVQFEPSGLRFQRLATLRIGAVGVLPAGSRRVGFSSASDGSRVQLSPPAVSNGGTEIPVAHFSSAGAANLTPGQIEQVPLEELADLSDPMFWFDAVMRLDPANFNPAGFAAVFTRWLDEFVNPEIAKASDTFEGTGVADIAYGYWFFGLKHIVSVIPAEEGVALQALLAPALAQTQTALARVYLDAINSRLASCQNLIFPISEASFFQTQAALFGIDTVEFGLDRPSFLRKVNDCLRPVLDPATLPSPLSPGQPASLDLRAQIVLNGQPDPIGTAFEFTITATDATVAAPVGFSDGAGRYTTVFTPSSAGPTFSVRACLVLIDGTSDICVTQQVPDGRPGQRIAAGDPITCAIRADGGVVCWGPNDTGQLGNGGGADSAVPQVVITTVSAGPPVLTAPLANVTSLAAGGGQTCALKSDGSVLCWGVNQTGQLGDGSTLARAVATPVPGVAGAIALAAGSEHTCALLGDGTVRCWGGNRLGQLGIGSRSQSPALAPVQVPGLAGVVELVAGALYTCARLGDGTVRCWGGQTFIVLGALSDGTAAQATLQSSPQPIPGLAGVLGIAAGDNHACVILGDRTAACWGANFVGQVGDGTQGIQPDGSETRFTPVAVVGLTGVAELVAGQAHTCARKLDGSVNCWGFNGRGQIGDGVSPESLPTSGTPLPAVVLNLTDAVQLTNGFNHSCALKRDRTLVCWGANEFGQLGDGTRTDRSAPVGVVGGVIF